MRITELLNAAYKDLQFVWFNNNWDKAGLSLLFLNNGVPVWEGEEEKNKFEDFCRQIIKTVGMVFVTS